MKLIILLLCLIIFAPFAAHAAKYRHKSEVQIKQMSPTQRVDEWVNEQVFHRFDVLDDQQELLRKYVTLDGLKALPRMIEIIDEYDPTRFREGKGRRGERFDACYEMLFYIDEDAIRLRGSEDGRQAINALDRAVERMKAAGYGRPEQDEWARHGRFDLAVIKLKSFKGVNIADKQLKIPFDLNIKLFCLRLNCLN